MKKTLLLIASIAGLLNLSAQQTITGTSPIGYSVSFGAATPATASTVPVSTIGANVTWNCSNLQSSAAFTLSMSAPSGMPYANDYAASNYNFNATAAGNLVLNEFYILNSDSLVKLGGRVTGQSYETYENPQLEFKFPFSYNNTVTDNYAKTSYNSGGAITSTQTGSITLSYVGYGTLILPMGTFTNVAMIQRIRTNSIGPTTTSYSWVKYPSGERLLEWSNNGGIKANYALAAGTVGIKENAADSDFSIYPSVSTGFITVTGINGVESVTVFDVSGKEIKNINNISGEKLEISIEEKGMFFVQIKKANGQTASKKIIVQ